MAGFVAAGPLPRTTTGSLELLPVAVYEVDTPNQLSCVCMAYVENAPHNPEVVGSNPAPATKKLQLVGLAGELFSCVLIGCFLGVKAMGARITRFRFTKAGSGRRFLRCVA